MTAKMLIAPIKKQDSNKLNLKYQGLTAESVAFTIR